MITKKLLCILACISLIIVGSGCTTSKKNAPRTPETNTTQRAPDELSGNYKLVAVNGKRIPAIVSHSETEITVHSGIFTINPDETCSSESIFTPASGDRITRKVNATCKRNGSKLLMQWEGAGVTVGTVDADIFTMNNHGMIFVYSRSGRIDETVDLTQTGKCDGGTTTSDITKTPQGVFDGFNSGLPFGNDCFGILIGFFTFRDSDFTVVNISTTSEHPPRPGEESNNKVLQLDVNVRGWAGVIHNFENAATDSWAPRDWAAFDEFSFWIYGRNTGTSLFVDILDNRNPNSTFDDAERYTQTFSDNFSGWKNITIPFRHMTRKNIGNNAPNDGLGLTQVHGWGLGALNTGGPVTYYLDDFELRTTGSNEESAVSGHSLVDYPINELPMYDNRKKTSRQKQADDKYIKYMTNQYGSRETAADAAAKLGWKVFYEGDKTTAIKRFNQAWLLDPMSQYAQWGFAVISQGRGRIEDAVRYYRIAIENGPQNSSLQRDYENALMLLNQ